MAESRRPRRKKRCGLLFLLKSNDWEFRENETRTNESGTDVHSHRPLHLPGRAILQDFDINPSICAAFALRQEWIAGSGRPGNSR